MLKTSKPSDYKVEALFDDFENLQKDLQLLTPRSPSSELAVARTYHKAILIASASNLEARVKWIVEDLFTQQGCDELGSFVRKNILSRGYHGLFDWKSEKATKFFDSFGDDCKDRYRDLMQTDESFKNEHDAFMRLGNRRNELVHQDYAEFNLNETPEELITLYRSAILFPERFQTIMFS